MFEPKQGMIPGYTGHQKCHEEADVGRANRVAQKQIPGYAGYIPGVASENVYGQTYGKTSFASSANAFPKGIDLPAHIKFGTSMKDQF